MKDFPLIRSFKSAAVGTIIVSAPLLLLALSPLTGVYAALLGFYLLPAALCVTAAVCGLLPAAVNACAALFAFYRLAGGTGLMLAALYSVPLLIAYLLLMRFRVPFWKACGGMILMHLLALAGGLAILQAMTNGDLYRAAGEGVKNWLDHWEMGDSLLYQFYAMGMIALPENMAEQAVIETAQGYALSAAARQDMLLSAQSMVESTLKSLIPSAIIQQSILGGVGCMLLSIRFGTIAEERRAFRSPDSTAKADFPDLGMQPLSLWYIPRGMGWKVGLAFVLGSVLRAMASSVPVAMAGVILYSASCAVFTVQGAALLNFMQKTKGTARIWRVVLPALLLMLSLLSYLGIFDQIVNIRGLRKPSESKEDNGV